MANVFYPGSTTNVLMGYESTYGTASAALTKNLGGQVQSFSLSTKNNLNEIGTVGSRATQALIVTSFDVSGSYDLIYTNGRSLAYGLGTDTETGASPNVHTIGVADVLSSFSLLLSADSSSDIVTTITGCMINSMKLSLSVGSPLTVSVDWIGQSVSTDTTGAGTPALDTTNTPMAPQFDPVATGVVKIGGTAIGQIQNFTMDINNNLEGIHAIGVRTINGLVAKRRTIDWSMSVLLEDATGIELIKEMLGTTSAPYTPITSDVGSKALVVALTNQGASTALRSITISCTGYKPEEVTFNTSLDGMTTMDVSGKITTFDTSPIVCTDDVSSDYITSD